MCCWVIEFKSKDFFYIKDFLQEKNILLLSPICFYDEENKSNGGYFIAVRNVDNNVFYCSISKDREDATKSILTVVYHKPY